MKVYDMSHAQYHAWLRKVAKANKGNGSDCSSD